MGPRLISRRPIRPPNPQPQAQNGACRSLSHEDDIVDRIHCALPAGSSSCASASSGKERLDGDGAGHHRRCGRGMRQDLVPGQRGRRRQGGATRCGAARRRHCAAHHRVRPPEGLHARTRNQTSLEFAAATASGDAAALRQIPGVIAIGGGVPIKVGTETIGAVGVSGAPGGDKDEICAKAGIARVAAALN